MFITLEGIDGSGKSTQARLLASHLGAAGREVVVTREPGGSTGAEAIRALLVQGAADRWSPETELLLFTAARRDHMERTIAPALARGAVVICDRFADSTRVYQGAARADLRGLVDRLHALAIGVEPDATLLLDLDPAVGLARATGRKPPPACAGEDRYESLGLDFQTRLRQGFLALAAEDPARIRVIDADGDAETVAARIRGALG